MINLVLFSLVLDTLEDLLDVHTSAAAREESDLKPFEIPTLKKLYWAPIKLNSLRLILSSG